MFITHSYIGQTVGKFRCLFFLVFEDYVETQTELVKELEPYLERFARNLKDKGAIVRPFIGDIETVRDHVLNKNWTNDELALVGTTPGLLMINVDFDEFNPREHPWVHIGLWSKDPSGRIQVAEVQRILEDLVNIVTKSDKDIFTEAATAKNEISVSDVASVFEAKPGIFGFSVDLIKAARFISKLYNRMLPQRA